MAIEDIRTYSDMTCWAPTVCSVDDAWFEGAHHAPLCDQLKLGGVHEQPFALSKLIEHIEHNPWDSDNGDGEYLEVLAKICFKYNFALALCNFEGLEKNWNKLNSKGTAILLDLRYENCPNPDINDPELYGLNLIYRLIKGRRPQSDIFVVTGGQTAFNNAVSAKKSDASWWPVRCFPVVSKVNSYDSLESELGGFAKYFQEGNQEIPVTQMLRSLVRARNEGFVWTHPDIFEKDVPSDLALRNLYEADCDSIKSLYNLTDNDNSIPPYSIKTSVLCGLLSASGFPVTFEDSFPINLRLPRYPFGIVWVAELHWLLKSLCKRNSQHSKATLTVSGNNAKLLIPLNSEFSKNLELALTAGQHKGDSTSALEALKSNNLENIVSAKLKDDERVIINELLKYQDYKATLNINVFNFNIIIEWQAFFI